MNRLAASTLILVLALAGSASAAPDAAPGGAAARPAPAAQPGAKQPAGTIGFQALPNVQIFSNQPAVNLRFGGPAKMVVLQGAVFGRTPFKFGSITVTPNVQPGQNGQSACPVYVNGVNNSDPNGVTTLQPNANFTVYVWLQAMPNTPARSSGICTLKYSALDQTTNGQFESGSGNQVNVPFTIKPPK